MLELQKVLWLTLKIAALGVVPYKTWTYFYNVYREEEQSYQDKLLHKKRHDCVVMFSPGKGHTGWCETQETNLNINTIKWLYEPFLYFIDTAKESLDVAIMSINVDCIIKSLMSASKKGVKVRVISDFFMNKKSYDYYKEMEKYGIQITFYVPKENFSYMHTKYIVKDFNIDGAGYLLTGSFNLTYGAFSNNYEDVVFTSQRQMVEDFQNNFSTIWGTFRDDNQQVFNRHILENAGFSLPS